MSLAVCAIFKNEAPYLREWIQFHRLMGFDKFHLFDNASTDDWRPEIQDLIDAGIVFVEFWPGAAQQVPVYNKFLETSKKIGYDWVAFIDVDEYIYSVHGETIDKALIIYKHYASVEINWVLFGSSAHTTKPDGLTIDNYIMRSEKTYRPNIDHVKSIVKPDMTIQFLDPHKVSTLGQKINSKSLVVNHYYTRSEEECSNKFARGRSDITGKRSMEEYYASVNDLSAVKDERIKDLWGEALRNSL